MPNPNGPQIQKKKMHLEQVMWCTSRAGRKRSPEICHRVRRRCSLTTVLLVAHVPARTPGQRRKEHHQGSACNLKALSTLACGALLLLVVCAFSSLAVLGSAAVRESRRPNWLGQNGFWGIWGRGRGRESADTPLSERREAQRSEMERRLASRERANVGEARGARGQRSASGQWGSAGCPEWKSGKRVCGDRRARFPGPGTAAGRPARIGGSQCG